MTGLRPLRRRRPIRRRLARAARRRQRWDRAYWTADVPRAQRDRARHGDLQGLLAVVAQIFMREQPPRRALVEQCQERAEELRRAAAPRALLEQQREDRSDQDVSAPCVLEKRRDETEVAAGSDLRDLFPVAHHGAERRFVAA